MLLDKLKLALDLFRKGKEVSNVEQWKLGQVTANMIAVFIIAVIQLVQAFGVEVPINNEQVIAISGGLLALVNVVTTVITTKRIGLKEKVEGDTQVKEN